MEYNKSTVFILPYLGFKYSMLKSAGFISSYVGNTTYEQTWGEYFHIIFENGVPDFAKQHRYFSHEYKDAQGHGAAFIIPDYIKTQVVIPFLDGKYSKIDKDYVDAHLKFKVGLNTYSNAYRICNKDNALRQEWEERLDVYLPDDAEVASRPKMEKEMLNFVTLKSSHDEDNVSIVSQGSETAPQYDVRDTFNSVPLP